MNAINPINTSTARNFQAISCFFVIALYANKKYKRECIGLRLFHQIFPPASIPWLRLPDMYIYIIPIAGNNARYPKYGKYFMFISFATNANSTRIPIQPTINIIILVFNDNIIYYIILLVFFYEHANKYTKLPCHEIISL